MLSFYGDYSLAEDDNYLYIYINDQYRINDKSYIVFNIADCSNNTITPVVINNNIFNKGLITRIPESGYLLYPYKYSKNIYPRFYSFKTYTDIPDNISGMFACSPGDELNGWTISSDIGYFQIDTEYNINDKYTNIFGAGNVAYINMYYPTQTSAPAPTPTPTLAPGHI